MNPYERRILHASLQDNPYVSTPAKGGALPARGHYRKIKFGPASIAGPFL